MYEDFKNINYWKTKKKLAKLEELMTRLLADSNIKTKKIDNLALSINNINQKSDKIITEPPILLPDLIVKDITLTDLGNGIYDIAYIIKNNKGQKTESTCSGRISSFGIGNKISVIPKLIKNEGYTIHTTWYYDPLGIPISFDITAEVDCYNEIVESNENNNTLTRTFINKTLLLIPTEQPPISYPPPLPGMTQIIVHCHNPEGKEINSYLPDEKMSVAIYDTNTLIDYGAQSLGEHSKVFSIRPGSHSINVRFNGMSLNQDIYLGVGETRTLTFTFVRTVFSSLLEYLPESEEVFGELPLISYISNFVSILFIDFPPNNSFSTWYIQSKANKYWKAMYLYEWYPYSSPLRVNSSGIDYSITTLSANSYYHGLDYHQYTIPSDFDYFKISSIPYDVLGVGF